MDTFATLGELVTWCRRAPRGTNLDARELAQILDGVAPAPAPAPIEAAPEAPATWRERLWTVPAETRLGVRDVAEAVGRPRSWVYARTGRKADDMLPHRKLDGVLVFVAGELRAWLRAYEHVVHGGPMESTPAERGKLHALARGGDR